MIRGPAAAALLLLGAAPAPAPAFAQARSCVDVRIGDELYYDCLNKRLQEAATGRRFTTDDAPLGVKSPPASLGQFNQAAVREKLGANYGKSSVPQRPPPPVFTNPLVPR